MSADDEMTSVRADVLLRTPKAEREQTDAEIMTAWSDWLYETHGGDLPEAVLHKIYGKAWEDGHSSGLQEVEQYFVELADWVEEILKIVR